MNYENLEKCIEDRLKNLSTRLDLDINTVKCCYMRNINNLHMRIQDYTHYSKLMYNAYNNTVKFYERRVK